MYKLGSFIPAAKVCHQLRRGIFYFQNILEKTECQTGTNFVGADTIVWGFKSTINQRRLSTSTNMAQKVTMILDCDVGVDDATALMMALGQPNVDLMAITCVSGNVGVNKVASNALRVLQECNRLDIPVYVGATTSIIGTARDAVCAHGDDGLGNIPKPKAPPSSDLLQSEHAIQALIRMVNEHPHKITLVAIGPLTNVALALRLDPLFTSKLKDLIIMGGNIKGRGTGFWTAEYNFGFDPEAAHIVLEETKCPTLLVPLETCIDHGLSLDWFDKLASKDSPRAQFMHAMNKRSTTRCREVQKLPTYMSADGSAMVVAIDRDSIEESVHSVCKVELQGMLTRGQVVTHKLNTPWIPELKGVEIEVVTKFDMKLFYKMLNDAVV
ncbi:nucleoside hydrolase-like [Lytechinus pictus]|uniref:nucleoside hydrolase-like n=1 Tax=Lytechinus pictus TaxID=7653 RepID=UPI0030BA0A85